MTLVCPWCKELYEEFVPHEDVDEGREPLPTNACESDLGFWVHGEGEDS